MPHKHPMRQQAIWEGCVNPKGTCAEFREYEVEQSIADRFEKMVRKHPHRVAVKTRDHELDFYELNSAANRIARAVLAPGGVGEKPVVLLFEQGTSMVSAILGVLKSGNCYVPLDTSYPLNRLKYLLGNTQASVIVTNRAATDANDDRNVRRLRNTAWRGTTGRFSSLYPSRGLASFRSWTRTASPIIHSPLFARQVPWMSGQCNVA